MKLALLQMTAGIDPAANAATLVDAVGQAAAGGAAMLFTPEMSGLLDSNRERAERSLTRQDDDPVLAAVRGAAVRNGVWVHIGSMAVRRDDGRLANRSFVIDATGAIRATYDKLHLFDVTLPSGETWRESASYAPGEDAVVLATPAGMMGLSICYDLRFSDLFRALSDAGATIFSVPAAFTVPTGTAHWHVLLRARAIEAGAFVVAAAQAGKHPDGRATFGHSLVVGPWGDVLLDMGDSTGVGFATIDSGRIDEVRGRIPVLAHRRALPPVRVVP